MNLRSKNVLNGVERAPNRSLFYAMGYTKEELEQPLIGVVSAHSEIVPGHFRHAQGRCSHDKAHHRITNGCATDGGPDQGIAENLTHGATTTHDSLGHPFPGRPITDRHHNQGHGLHHRQSGPA